MTYPEIDRRKENKELTEINIKLAAGEVRMDALEQAVAVNTALTQEIAKNTAGFVAFQSELESGAMFICRFAKALRFMLKEVVEPFWKPVGIVWLGWYLFNHDSLPVWLDHAIKLFGGM